ncbi:hypothetical protein COB57_01310 [Candidatus Peregrinibacteria bacterium]|nr:MAG: hypothetical protein COB57_01310 [Candidatus Peregrinibacteria bacterium]
MKLKNIPSSGIQDLNNREETPTESYSLLRLNQMKKVFKGFADKTEEEYFDKSDPINRKIELLSNPVTARRFYGNLKKQDAITLFLKNLKKENEESHQANREQREKIETSLEGKASMSQIVFLMKGYLKNDQIQSIIKPFFLDKKIGDMGKYFASNLWEFDRHQKYLSPETQEKISHILLQHFWDADDLSVSHDDNIIGQFLHTVLPEQNINDIVDGIQEILELYLEANVQQSEESRKIKEKKIKSSILAYDEEIALLREKVLNQNKEYKQEKEDIIKSMKSYYFKKAITSFDFSSVHIITFIERMKAFNVDMNTIYLLLTGTATINIADFRNGKNESIEILEDPTLSDIQSTIGKSLREIFEHSKDAEDLLHLLSKETEAIFNNKQYNTRGDFDNIFCPETQSLQILLSLLQKPEYAAMIELLPKISTASLFTHFGPNNLHYFNIIFAKNIFNYLRTDALEEQRLYFNKPEKFTNEGFEVFLKKTLQRLLVFSLFTKQLSDQNILADIPTFASLRTYFLKDSVMRYNDFKLAQGMITEHDENNLQLILQGKKKTMIEFQRNDINIFPINELTAINKLYRLKDQYKSYEEIPVKNKIERLFWKIIEKWAKNAVSVNPANDQAFQLQSRGMSQAYKKILAENSLMQTA